MKGYETLSFWSVKCPKGDNRRHFVAMKKTKKLPFAYLEDSAFTAVKVREKVCERGIICR